MEHFNENVEASELQTSNDVPVDLEPSDEALEQDSQELEQPPESQNNNWLDSSDTEDDPEESADDYPLEKPEREYPEEELEFVDLNPDKPKAESSEDEESAPEETKPEALEDEELEFVDLGSDEPKAEVPEEEEQATVDSDSDADDDDSDAVLRHDLALRQYPPEATEDNDSELRHPNDQHKNPYLVDDSTDGNNTQQDLSADLSETESESDREQGTLPDLNNFETTDTNPENIEAENPENEYPPLEDLDGQELDYGDSYSEADDLDAGPTLRLTKQPEADTSPEKNIDTDVQGQNFHPVDDTKDAFDYADTHYPRSSAYWQETANRRLDDLTAEKADLDTSVSDAKADMDDKYNQVSNYVLENNISRDNAANNPEFRSRYEDYTAAKDTHDDLCRQRNMCQAEIDNISADLDPNMHTTFTGMHGADFNNSYNSFITDQQGSTVPGFGGTCGINETCNLVNQQTGSDLGEADGINAYRNNGWCVTGQDYASNGGTNAVGRCQFLDSQGLTYDRVDGRFGSSSEISLDDIADRFKNGESAGLMVKAEDLSQPDLASRKFDFSKTFAENQNRYNANHATTIAGFSYYDDGKVAGVWLNDTGYWADNNRVYIDADKFNQMQRDTKGFAVEFSKQR